MIRQLTAKDHEQVLPFLQKEPSKNLYIIGDIEIYGYQQDFQELWGEWDREGNVSAVLLRFYDFFILYGKTGYNAKGMVEIMDRHKHLMISGAGEVLDELDPYLPLNKYQRIDTYFSECTKNTINESDHQALVGKIKKATIQDVERIIKLEDQIVDFGVSENTSSEREAWLRKNLEAKTSRVYYIEEEGEMVSKVSTNGENSVSAMIVNVCTLPKYRKQGYLSVLLAKTVADLLQEKETVCLFYDNPEAGKIYQKIGFKETGTWRMYNKLSESNEM